jgi:hypothetical protein
MTAPGREIGGSGQAPVATIRARSRLAMDRTDLAAYPAALGCPGRLVSALSGWPGWQRARARPDSPA